MVKHDFMVASCSSTELHTLPCSPTSKIANSPSLPDVNDVSLQEVVGTILASCCSSLSHTSRKHFSEGHKFRSPVFIALMVLKSQFLALKRRAYTLEVENNSLTLANGALLTKIASYSDTISRLQAENKTLLGDRKKLTLVVEHDQQKIRALTSDIDNAQQFIMAMVDIKLHENFLHVAANDTLLNGEDAEKSLAKAIAQEAGREGSLWSKILSSLVENSYGAAFDLALQGKDVSSRDDGAPQSEVGLKAAHVLPPPPGLLNINQVSSERKRISRDSGSNFASHSKATARSSTRSTVSRKPDASSVRVPNANSSPSKVSGLRIRYNREKHRPVTTQATHTRPFLTPKIEDPRQKPTRKGIASKKTIQRHEPQQIHTKKLDKRKGIILTTDVATTSISQDKVEVKEKASLFTALSSLERICALLSSSDLGSLEETSDDDNLEGGKSIKLHMPADGTVEDEGLDDASDIGTATEKSHSSVACLVRDSPDFSPSISSSPPSTPPSLAWSFSSEKGSTESSDVTLIVKQEPTVDEDRVSIRSSLNFSRFPKVSGIARRFSRVVTRGEHNIAVQIVSDTASKRSAASPPASTTTLLKNVSAKTSKSSTVVSSARPNLLSSQSTSSKRPSIEGKSAPFARPPEPSVGPAKRAKGVVELRTKVDATLTSNTSRESKSSVGRDFLRRLSNIPASVSRTRFGSATSELSQNSITARNRSIPPSVSPSRTDASKIKSPTPKSPVLTGVNGTIVSKIASLSVHKTKPRSNTVNGYLPIKPSPLSQNVVNASLGTQDSRKRRSVPVMSNSTEVALTAGARRTSDPDKPVSSGATSLGLVGRRPSVKRPDVKNGECEPPVPTPTAAFMKPVNKHTTKAVKRKTNSIKPLIPTWTAGSSSSSSLCGDMFRNTLSMIVR